MRLAELEGRTEDNTDIPIWFGQFLFWCYRWDCEIQLRNLHQKTPLQSENSFWKVDDRHERQADGSIVDLSRSYQTYDILLPELIFKKGNRVKHVQAQSFTDLINMVKHLHKQIFMELSVPYFNLNESKK